MLIKEELNDNPVMTMFFSGYAGFGKECETFEWYKMGSELGTSSVFLLDPDSKWYHPNINEILDRFSDTSRGCHLITVGVSMGGYAALLFGHLLGAKATVTFGPQTTISPRERHINRKWYKRMEEIEKTTEYPQYIDLAKTVTGTHHHIYYGEDFELDRLHAERIEGASLFPQPFNGHAIAQFMKKKGTLTQALKRAVNVGRGHD